MEHKKCWVWVENRRLGCHGYEVYSYEFFNWIYWFIQQYSYISGTLLKKGKEGIDQCQFFLTNNHYVVTFSIHCFDLFSNQ